MRNDENIPSKMQEKHDAIVGLLDPLCRERLNDEYRERISGLQHQLGHIDAAISAISGRSVKPKGEKQPRRDYEEIRGRVGRWMEGRKGQKFSAGDLIREFPELEGTPISYFMKPLIEAGTVKTDASEGPKRLKYFAAEG